ncbi:MAG TPA: ribonuclease R [Gammaproteobacteria bacterium]|nr:ribonuclease R [Gammaproteobacteria bacterium]
MAESQDKTVIDDPYREREASKYDHPIPSRECILAYLESQPAPAPMAQVAQALQLDDEEQLEALRRRLRAMERDGQLIRNRRGDYGPVSKMDLVRGRIIGHPDGYGFLVPEDGGDDVFLSARHMRSLLHGDRAMVCITGVDRRGRREGALVEVLERANHLVVGRFRTEHGLGFVIPSNTRINQDILVPPEHQAGAAPGQIVEAELVEQPSPRSQPIGRITKVLGDHMAPGMETDIAIRTYELPHEWSPEVLREAAALGGEVPEAAVTGREDLRGLPLVTIDGEDSRDFDDAVYCEPHGKGWRLIVAIADVSAYVQPGTALDRVARERGNSVYFPDRVIPMLPEALSNGLCSLNPDVDRLCMACELILTAAGGVRRFRFFDAVMRSAARLTYTEVAKVLAGEAAAQRGRSALVPHLETLHGLYQALRHRREQRGAIDFDTTETRIEFGAHRKIKRIVPVERTVAHRIIEECMIVANVAAAEFLLERQLPALYRVHSGPSAEKLAGLRAFLAELGLRLGGGDEPEARHVAKLLNAVRGRPDAHLIQTVLLRSLSQAVYTPDNSGHFGLAFPAYTHFTSPIRRYPDLLVHRALRHAFSGGEAHNFAYGYADMLAAGEHCSMTERRADEATRDAVDWLKCEYMRDKVGDEFEGVITSVTSFGLFVELKDIFVEGLVHVTALGKDYFHFDPVKHSLIGERSHTVYRLADTVRVQVVRVDLDERKIDFELAQTRQPSRRRRRRAA